MHIDHQSFRIKKKKHIFKTIFLYYVRRLLTHYKLWARMRECTSSTSHWRSILQRIIF